MAPLVWLAALKWVDGADQLWLSIRVWHVPPSGVDVTGAVEARTDRSMFCLGTPKGL
jgi:hypothetical protein